LIEEGSAALRAGDAATARRAFASALAEVEPGGPHGGLDHREHLRPVGRAEQRMMGPGPDHPRGGRRGGPERGWALIIRNFSEPDPQAREALLRDAVAIGRRFGDPDVEFEALSFLGGVLLMTDRVEEGLVLFDEALAAACAGELPQRLD
jgi:hypothetical protein